MAALSKECLIAALSQEFLKARNASKGRISKDLAHHTVVRLGRGSTVNTVFTLASQGNMFKKRLLTGSCYKKKLPTESCCKKRLLTASCYYKKNSLLRARVPNLLVVTSH